MGISSDFSYPRWFVCAGRVVDRRVMGGIVHLCRGSEHASVGTQLTYILVLAEPILASVSCRGFRGGIVDIVLE